MPSHRPFWVLRHRVTGALKLSGYGSVEDGMWEAVLTDGSFAATMDHQHPPVKPKHRTGKPKARKKRPGGKGKG
jgi:hypothetical protein